MLRNLGKMTEVGLLGCAVGRGAVRDRRGWATPRRCARRACTRSRCWSRSRRTPRVTASRGKLTWKPRQKIVDALDRRLLPVVRDAGADGRAHAARARRVGLDDGPGDRGHARASRRASAARRWRWSRRRSSRTTSIVAFTSGTYRRRTGASAAASRRSRSRRACAWTTWSRRRERPPVRRHGLRAADALGGRATRCRSTCSASTPTARPGRATSTRSRRCARTARRRASARSWW